MGKTAASFPYQSGEVIKAASGIDIIRGIPDLLYWFDASDVSSVWLDGSSKIMRWIDKVSGFSLYQATPANRMSYVAGQYAEAPISTVANLTYDPGQLKHLTLSSNGEFTQFDVVYIAGTVDTNVGLMNIMSDAAGALNRRPFINIETAGGGTWACKYAATASASVPIVFGTKQILATRYFSGSIRARINADAEYTNAQTARTETVVTSINFGKTTGLTSVRYHEMIYFNRNLTTDEYDLVRNYLNRKWLVY